MMKRVIDLGHEKARDFFMKSESYVQISLPEYFDFQELLNRVSASIGKNRIESFFSAASSRRTIKPSEVEGDNFKFLQNKDGRFAWRPFQFIHPALYISLVNEITKESQWNLIVNKFEEFQSSKHIKCVSLPVYSENNSTDKSAQVKMWWRDVEQESLRLSLKYNFLLHTDISDCYGSLYTHSVPWALHGKSVAKNMRGDKKLVGNIIDTHLRYMSNGQTNGIPQGSVLMDFIAEMVLGYVDNEMCYKLKGIKDYHIIRYRDDYRIFTNDIQNSDEIVKRLSETLTEVGMRLNTQKTLISDSVIKDSLKSDKRYRIMMRNTFSCLQKRLHSIHELSLKFPNSGSLDSELSDFLNDIKTQKEITNNIEVFIGIVVDIAFRNPRTYPICAAILSKFISLIRNKRVKRRILIAIKRKFAQLPNTAYLMIWIQKISITVDKTIIYDEKLCSKVTNEKELIWNSEWLKPKMRVLVDSIHIVDYSKIDKMSTIIDPKQVQLFSPIS